MNSNTKLPHWPLWLPFATFIAVVAFISGLFTLNFMALDFMEIEVEPKYFQEINLLATMLQTFFIVFFLRLFAKKTSGGANFARFGIKSIHWKSLIVWTLVGVISWKLTAHYLSLLLYGIKGNGEQVRNTGSLLGIHHGGFITIGGFICLGLLGPVAEELLFRGVLFPALARWIKIVPAMILSSILFALVHFATSSFFDMILLTSFGMICVLLYKQSGSLIPSMIFHAINNTVVFGHSMRFHWVSTLLLSLGVALTICSLLLFKSSKVSTAAELPHEEPGLHPQN